jgi:hypothetical protein
LLELGSALQSDAHVMQDFRNDEREAKTYQKRKKIRDIFEASIVLEQKGMLGKMGFHKIHKAQEGFKSVMVECGKLDAASYSGPLAKRSWRRCSWASP